MPIFLLKNPMIVQSPWREMRASLVSLTTQILIKGLEFLTTLMLLDSATLDVILGMDWLTKHQCQIQHADRAVTLVITKGIEVNFINGTPFCQACAVHNLKSLSLEDVPIVREYKDVFP